MSIYQTPPENKTSLERLLSSTPQIRREFYSFNSGDEFEVVQPIPYPFFSDLLSELDSIPKITPSPNNLLQKYEKYEQTPVPSWDRYTPNEENKQKTFYENLRDAVSSLYKIFGICSTTKEIIHATVVAVSVLTGGSAMSYSLFSSSGTQNNTGLHCSQSRETIEGKLCRVKRWEKNIEATEAAYGIPSGLLAGIAMTESYGDPTETNSDGSAGLFQLEPHIAEQYGLQIYYKGNNPRTSLQYLMRNQKDKVEVLQAYDERFNVEKAAETAGHYLSDLHADIVQRQSTDIHLQSHNAWDLAAAAYAVNVSSADAHLDSHGTYIELVHAHQRYYVQQVK